MIICICNNVDFGIIQKTISVHGAETIDDLQRHLSICNQCHCCTFQIQEIIDQHRADKNELRS